LLAFDWGVLLSQYDHFQELFTIILSKAEWIVTADEISFLAQQAENVF
jgi:hypothetical protein